MLDGRDRGHHRMRAFLGIAAICFGVTGTAPAFAQSLTDQSGIIVRTLKGDRLAAPRPEQAVKVEAQADSSREARTAYASAVDAPLDDMPLRGQTEEPTTETTFRGRTEELTTEMASAPTETETGLVHRIPLEEFCDMIVSSARANDLPVVFFSNLIWQESRFNPNSVSHAGAQGVAQFMPETAAANGLDNPFNPFQAVPASARLLRQLHDQFGNVGLAAAAYNAGPGRVAKWLSKHASLPRETRAYVSIITGRPAEQWRAAEAQNTFRPAKDLPCSRTPAFAELQAAQGELETDAAPAEAAKIPAVRVAAAVVNTSKKARGRVAVRGTLKIRSKPVQLTLVAPEPGQASGRPKKGSAGAARKQRHVRVASTTP
jgi:soluble lytic murein transglycosylase-like protein